ncbi:hypothetical protein A3G67_03160 [Candidatus Roizmanbacteria bacterium RIFCSPLOWO2_12_FULL_40_12]|uniref:Erythromycin biosynthesis sensory transduction protein eryC1 n=1 Tax=Candidatus Roizmanbacteria bacterium RIFCSPLOWO2_01_FULL_40_42 TaxID=1802066 RepID=A0A1F7J5V4_9BACT|nr:MAG: hypothetical protein A2779_02795 [Candidatus Roizmanbacteria bacterium RIFCSPHIGHO2_01_FULL_40_98]OGK28416.1 MAG: hypothetical protein A3C31_00160 [Candidatus Roizmanbacteria bacterium RIFCSPHIGHO2_02_FULL_40_53]OGK30652.1 MAG: hypothetical protein A2W49_02845 [Candidatus Roizmanbacteria bacterium RIFCSPHIGHO2_12_41_18]OGK37041.1 MAG: hypothetical protein A3E69_00420 [Candidatus Roizmanbacteria bacterium RIFCSPHIGHO2_12_FULL_40_130]OGK50972.1 MAG: hypothetical protein A3B50_00930 [Candi
MVEFVDLKRQYATINKEVSKAISNVLSRQTFVLGNVLEKFESSFASYLGISYVVGVDNGTDGLNLALEALGIGKGDEVITPVNSFISTTFCITNAGATPVFVDVDPDTHQLNINQVKKKISKKTRAILPVHLYGAACDIESLVKICKKHRIFLVEDACQAQGSSYKRKKLGTFGVAGVFSFYPGKNLGAYGNGGAIVTKSKSLYMKLLKLRNFGQQKRYYHDSVGHNSKLDDIQAAVLSVKLRHLDDWNKKRNKLAEIYKKMLKDLKFPKILKDSKSNFHLLIIECKHRSKLQAYLLKKGIKAQIHYPVPIHLQKCYKRLGYKKGDFPVAEKLASTILSLPIYPELRKKEVEYIAREVNNFYGT